MPNLQAEARQLASDVMNGVNGSPTTSLLDNSLTSRGSTPDGLGKKPSSVSFWKPPTPLRASSRDHGLDGDETTKTPGGSTSENMKRFDNSSESADDTDSRKDIREEHLLPKSEVTRPKGEMVDEAAARLGRGSQDSRPSTSGSEQRSPSVIRSPSTKSASSNSKVQQSVRSAKST